MTSKTKANLFFLLGFPFMTIGVFLGRTLGLPYWSDPIFIFIGLAFFYPGYRILKGAVKTGKIQPASAAQVNSQFLFVVVPLLALLCMAVPFLMPYLDPKLNLPTWGKLTVGFFAFPISAIAFWIGLKSMREKP